MLELWTGLTEDNQIKLVLVFLGAFLAVLGYLGKRWFEARKSSTPSNVNTASQGGITQTNTDGINAAHTGTGDIQIGITLEQYEGGLTRREAEVEERLEQAHAEDREALLIEQQALQQRLQDSKQSYQAHIADLRKRIAQLETIRGDVPDELLDQAKTALANGESKQADALFQQVEDQAQGPIKAAAEAAYQRCQIAQDEINYRKANAHCQRAVQLSPDNTLYLNGAGEMAHILGQYHKAIEYYERALSSDLKTFGADHPNVALYRSNLGSAWRALGETHKAIEYFELALSSDLKTFGADHLNVALYRNNLGEAWQALGETHKAIEYFELALSSDLKTFGEDHLKGALYRNNLGIAWQALGEYHKAIEYYEQALTVFKHKLDNDHPNTRTVRDNLSAARQAMAAASN